MVAETYAAILHHRSVQDVALSNKVGYKRVDRFIIDICRCTNLLNLTLAHYYDGITQCQCLFLIVCHINKGNSQTAVHFLQLHLHILTHLQVQCSQRFIQQQHFRLIHNGTGNCYTLLLSSRQRIHITIFVIRHSHHLQRSLHFLLHFSLRHLLQFQTESNVIIHIQMRKQRIFLKHGIHRSLVRRCLRNFLSGYTYFSLRSSLKTSYQSQQRSLSTSGWSQNCYKFTLFNREVYMIQRSLFSKKLGYILYLNNRHVLVLH